MTEEEKIKSGVLFCPGDPTLKAMKLRAHNLNLEYNALPEDEAEKRSAILEKLVGSMGSNCFMQGPIFFHYGRHTKIGDSFFANFNFTVQDDGDVTIGDRCAFGPNVTIVTPLHPMLPQEREYVFTPRRRKEAYVLRQACCDRQRLLVRCGCHGVPRSYDRRRLCYRRRKRCDA